MNTFSSYFIFFVVLFTTPHIIAQHKDCNTALELCGVDPFYFVSGSGTGIADPDIANSCLGQEFNSMWVKWTVMEDGIITFVLTGDTSAQDLDFIVFKSESDYDCDHKTPIRCMAAGANTGQPPHQWVNCSGATGLAVGNTDVEEPAGCSSNSNNFLAPIEAVAGDQYIMLINDFSQSGFGYTLSFTGTAVLGCITSTAYPELTSPPLLFSVYPTVSTGTISIRANGAAQPGNLLTIFNTEGQVVYSNEQLSETAFQVDLHHLPPGVYFANLRTRHSTQTQKFLITQGS